jgi:hypothetical protein
MSKSCWGELRHKLDTGTELFRSVEPLTCGFVAAKYEDLWVT